MKRPSRRHLWCLLAMAAGFSANAATQPDAVSAVQILREGGCGGILPPARPLHRNALLDRAAEQWAAGGNSPAAAAKRSGYDAGATAGLHVRGPESSTVQLLRQSGCRTLTDQSLHDVGVYHHGLDTWLVLATARVAPAAPQAPMLATRTLQLVNEIRARGTRCGERSFAPAPPVKVKEETATEQAPAKPALPVSNKPAPGRQSIAYLPPTDTPPTTAGQPMVQIAAVARPEDAAVLVSALRQRGYGVVVRNEPQDKLLHVQVGPFADRTQATVMKQKLLSDGYNAIIKQ